MSPLETSPFNNYSTFLQLQELLSKVWRWNRCEGRMLMAWNSGDWPLHTGVLPPFLYGKGIHNHWVINEAVSSELRFVFDASWTISSFHLNHQDHWPNGIVGDSRVSDIENRRWEYVGNSHIGALYGSLLYREANYSSLIKLLKCSGQYVFTNTTEKTVYPYGYQSARSLCKRRILHSWWKKRIVACVDAIKSLDKILDCSLKDQMRPSAPLDFSFSLESLLPLIADKNKTIVLAVAGYSYKDMLMNWVCRLRRLLITNFMICALDQETYSFSVLQVFMLHYSFYIVFFPSNFILFFVLINFLVILCYTKCVFMDIHALYFLYADML